MTGPPAPIVNDEPLDLELLDQYATRLASYSKASSATATRRGRYRRVGARQSLPRLGL